MENFSNVFRQKEIFTYPKFKVR